MQNILEKFPQKINLALLPTPFTPLRNMSKHTPGIELFIKRDDLTGCELSGNKARKLEFVLAEAQRKKSTFLITCGGVQSNHARATAIAGKQLGMKSLLMLRGEEPALPEANLILDLLVGAKIKYVSDREYLEIMRIMGEEADSLSAEGETPYLIPEGGSNALGSLGYAMAIDELKKQLNGDKLDYIVAAVGSGGTLAGLIMGCQLFGLTTKVIGINVCAKATYFEKRVAGIIREAGKKFGLPVGEGGGWEIIDGYPGLGYARTRPAELATMRLMAEEEGIILDPVYTAKAFHGLLSEIKKGRFGTDKKIAFLHTGGIFGLLTQTYSAALFNPNNSGITNCKVVTS